jgi:Zn-dependent protease
MKLWKRLLVAAGGIVGGGAAFLAGNIAISIGVVGAVHALGYWAYPTFFGVNVLLAAFVFLVLWPLDDAHRIKVPLFTRCMARLACVPWIANLFVWLRTRVAFDERKLQKGIWAWARKRGPFFLVLVCSFFPGPFFAALVIRFLGLPPQRAWAYAVTTTMISTVVTISGYLGVIDGIRSFLASAFS